MRPRLIVIVGTTGVGKTKLSIQLAKALNGEVVNADAMQMYRGLDVATAKATAEEQDGVPHHLLSVLDPWEEVTVRDFRRMAEPVIADIASRGRVPIVVGGTFYYVQSLLWSGGTLEGVPGAQADDGGPATRVAAAAGAAVGEEAAEDVRRWVLDFRKRVLPADRAEREALSARMHALLAEVDPESADRYHKFNIRRVQRQLEIFFTTGVTASELRRRQQAQLAGDSGVGKGGTGAPENEAEDRDWGIGLITELGRVKYDALAVWLRADKPVLHERLNARVGEMQRSGLLQECRRLYAAMARSLPATGSAGEPVVTCDPLRHAADHEQFTRGVAQAIGFKELFPYLKQEVGLVGQGAVLDAADALGEPRVAAAAAASAGAESSSARPHPVLPLAGAETAFAEGIEQLRLATRQYSRKQVKWMRNRFVGYGVPTMLLDTTDVTVWDERVRQPALDVASAFLTGARDDAPVPPELDAARFAAAEFARLEEHRQTMRRRGERREAARLEKRRRNAEWIAKKAAEARRDARDEDKAAKKTRSHADV